MQNIAVAAFFGNGVVGTQLRVMQANVGCGSSPRFMNEAGPVMSAGWYSEASTTDQGCRAVQASWS